MPRRFRKTEITNISDQKCARCSRRTALSSWSGFIAGVGHRCDCHACCSLSRKLITIVLYRGSQIFLDAVQTDTDIALRNAHDFGNLAIRESIQIQDHQGPLGGRHARIAA